MAKLLNNVESNNELQAAPTPNKPVSPVNHQDLSGEEADEVLDMLYSKRSKNLLYTTDDKDG